MAEEVEYGTITPKQRAARQRNIKVARMVRLKEKDKIKKGRVLPLKHISMRHVFIPLMLTLIVATSTFLIIESSRYYGQWYGMGYSLFLALLLESFVIVLATSRVTWALLRFVQRSLMFSVFILIVGSASLYHVSPIITTIAKHGEDTKVSVIIQQEIDQLRKDLSVFSKQNQRRNTALVSIKRHDTFKKLLETAQNTKQITLAMYLDMAVLIFIRLILQTCNLFCAGMIGTYYRGEKVPILREKRDPRFADTERRET